METLGLENMISMTTTKRGWHRSTPVCLQHLFPASTFFFLKRLSFCHSGVCFFFDIMGRNHDLVFAYLQALSTNVEYHILVADRFRDHVLALLFGHRRKQRIPNSCHLGTRKLEGMRQFPGPSHLHLRPKYSLAGTSVTAIVMTFRGYMVSQIWRICGEWVKRCTEGHQFAFKIRFRHYILVTFSQHFANTYSKHHFLTNCVYHSFFQDCPEAIWWLGHLLRSTDP